MPITHGSTSHIQKYTLTNFPIGEEITLVYTGKIISGNHSAVNKSTITPDKNFYRDINVANNMSVAQTFIKPILTQPASITTCPDQSFRHIMESDNPFFTKYEWNSVTSNPSTIHSHKPLGTGAIEGIIENRTRKGGKVIYTITPTITAPILSADGTASSAFTITTGEAKTFTVTVPDIASAPSVHAQAKIVKYKKDVVLIPSSPSLISPVYHWYYTTVKTNPVKEGSTLTSENGGTTTEGIKVYKHIKPNGVLTIKDLLPGTYTFYVSVSNNKHCESTVSPVTITIEPIAIIIPPNVLTPSMNYIWTIPLIEQYPHCIVKIFNRYGKLIYNVNNSAGYYNKPFNGRSFSFGQYYYTIDLRDGSKIMTGSFSILH